MFQHFHSHLPIDEAGCLQILYYIRTMLEEPWNEAHPSSGLSPPPNTAQLVLACRERECRANVHVFSHAKKKERREDKDVTRGLV